MAEASANSVFEQWFNVAGGHLQAGRWEEAQAIYRRILQAGGNISVVHHNLGVALMSGRRWEEAAASFQAALALQPDSAEAWNNLGDVLRRLGQRGPAMDAFRRALTHRRDFPDAWNNLGISLRQVNQPAEAIDAYRKAVALRKDYAAAWHNLGGALKDAGQLGESLACFDRAIAIQPQNPVMASSRLCTLHYHPNVDASAIFDQASRWNLQFARPLLDESPRHPRFARDTRNSDPWRRLRIGYVSGDVHRHSHALYLTPLWSHHNHQDFEIYCFSDVAQPDAVTARLLRHVDVWRDISGMSDQVAADLIHSDHIDILVDLSLHTAGHRLLVFARKPAPVQVTWLGYPGTTGMDTIDYRLTDPRLDPVEAAEIQSPKSEARNPKSESTPNDQNPNGRIANGVIGQQETLRHLDIGKLTSASSVEPGFDSDFGFRISDFSTQEPHYSEHSLRLQDTFWCYDPRGMEDSTTAEMPEPGPLPALAAGHVTFGCLNNFCKVTQPTLALWAKVLAAAPTSRLLVMAPPGPPRESLLNRLGVGRERVEITPYQRRRPYLETYRRIDLCLDTIPYNGHTTSLDALWMGVPVVTRVGETVVGRAGLSQLHHLGLSELAARTDEQYVQLAAGWAGDLDRLGQTRATLRQRMERSPLMDGARFARSVEAAYRQMWEAWRQIGKE